MTALPTWARRLARGYWRDRRGAIAAIVALTMPALIVLMALVLDVGQLYAAQRALQLRSDAAALAASADLVNSGSQSGASTSQVQVTAQQYASESSGTSVPLNSLTAVATPKCLTSINVQSDTSSTGTTTNEPFPGIACGGTIPYNGVSVTVSATVNTFLMGIIGIPTVRVTTTSTATATGTPWAADIMIILDTTHAMAATDTSCTTNSQSNSAVNSTSPTKEVCAEVALQAFLQQLTPSLDHVGLMIIGNTTGLGPGSYSCGGAITRAAYPTSSANNHFEVVPLSSDYKLTDGATVLANNGSTTNGNGYNGLSSLVGALYGINGCAGLTPMTSGTSCSTLGYCASYAEVLNAAYTALTNAYGNETGGSSSEFTYATPTSGSTFGSKITLPRTYAQKVIVLIADGDAEDTTGGAKPCTRATAAASNIISTSTQTPVVWIYSVAYNASTSTLCTSSSADNQKPCAVMSAIGYSQPYVGGSYDYTKFYSDYEGSATGCTNSATNPSTILSQIMAQIGQNLTAPRLIPNNTT